jgi:hypothetical protein
MLLMDVGQLFTKLFVDFILQEGPHFAVEGMIDGGLGVPSIPKCQLGVLVG